MKGLEVERNAIVNVRSAEPVDFNASDRPLALAKKNLDDGRHS